MQTLYWLNNAKKPFPENQYLKTDSQYYWFYSLVIFICTGEKAKSGVFWKIGVSYVGVLKYSLVI